MRSVTENNDAEIETENDNIVSDPKGEKDDHGPTDSTGAYHHTLLHK